MDLFDTPVRFNIKPMIQVKNVSKRYGDFEAVKDLSFSAGRGEVLGLLGPNGAGKTTIMKILTGCHFPSGGEVTIDGYALPEKSLEIKKRIGYLPENVPLYADMSAREYLSFAAAARLIPKAERKRAVENAVAASGLEGFENRRIGTLSKGYRQRAGLAQAILHDPPILILDEPGSGLDPNQIIETRSLIRELGKSKTVILSTHILQEVEALCGRVLILNEGRIAAQGTPEEIARSLKAGTSDAAGGVTGNTWEVLLKGLPEGISAREIKSRLARLGREPESFSAETLSGGIWRLCFVTNGRDYAADGELIFDWALSQGCKIIGMNRKGLSLEDIFVKLMNEPSAGGEGAGGSGGTDKGERR